MRKFAIIKSSPQPHFHTIPRVTADTWSRYTGDRVQTGEIQYKTQRLMPIECPYSSSHGTAFNQRAVDRLGDDVHADLLFALFDFDLCIFELPHSHPESCTAGCRFVHNTLRSSNILHALPRKNGRTGCGMIKQVITARTISRISQ